MERPLSPTATGFLHHHLLLLLLVWVAQKPNGAHTHTHEVLMYRSVLAVHLNRSHRKTKEILFLLFSTSTIKYGQKRKYRHSQICCIMQSAFGALNTYARNDWIYSAFNVSKSKNNNECKHQSPATQPAYSRRCLSNPELDFSHFAISALTWLGRSNCHLYIVLGISFT